MPFINQRSVDWGSDGKGEKISLQPFLKVPYGLGTASLSAHPKSFINVRWGGWGQWVLPWAVIMEKVREVLKSIGMERLIGLPNIFWVAVQSVMIDDWSSTYSIDKSNTYLTSTTFKTELQFKCAWKVSWLFILELHYLPTALLRSVADANAQVRWVKLSLDLIKRTQTQWSLKWPIAIFLCKFKLKSIPQLLWWNWNRVWMVMLLLKSNLPCSHHNASLVLSGSERETVCMVKFKWGHPCPIASSLKPFS